MSADSDLGGQRLFLRLHAKAWPELAVECELAHGLAASSDPPRGGGVRVSAGAGRQRYHAEAELRLEGCSVRGKGVVEAQRGLRGSLVYHNNCSAIQVSGRHGLPPPSSRPVPSDPAVPSVRSGAARTAWSPPGPWTSLPLLPSPSSPWR